LPRGDLYHWTPLLDRFDHILELFNNEYGLDQGPQDQPFELRLLQRGDADDGYTYPSAGATLQELSTIGYDADGDRELVEAVVSFSRILLEHCGNRSLYASSTHVNNLLHTTSLSLLRVCLKLSLRLAQRYQVARYKNHHPSSQPQLLASHYNFNFDNLQKLAQPFPKPAPSGSGLGLTHGKGKEKSAQTSGINTSDLVSIAKDKLPKQDKAELSSVSLSYYEQTTSSATPQSKPSLESTPATPTPIRRSSTLGPSRERPSPGERSSSTNDVGSSPAKLKEAAAVATNAPRLFQLSSTEVNESTTWTLVREATGLPAEIRYDLLHRMRIAKAFASDHSEVLQLLEIRLLAIANLAYALPESRFQEKVGIPDSDEPRRFHLAQQLCDLLQPGPNGQNILTLQAETTVLVAIEALSRSKHKVSEVADALAITVNHGMLYYGLRRAISSLKAEDHADKTLELQENDWRDAIFDLVNSLLQSGAQSRYGERMVAAGIIGILVEALELRTSRADRFHEKVLQFFDSFIHGIPSALQNLANVKGLDIISDLTAYEVQTALTEVRNGNGLPTEFKSKVVDYTIPYFKQSALRQLFKNTAHMFDHHTGTQDRLLRNLIDTPQTLGALRSVIENSNVFGSNVWSGAVSIVNQFINHEPTMYQVIGEAGLTKSFLESITGQEFQANLSTAAASPPDSKATPSAATGPKIGILPVGEVMCDIPSVFGAICLNETGMQVFLDSGALAKYFEIFLSPVHVRAMEEEGQVAATIGNSFDELSRHQPRLKTQIMAAIHQMLTRLRNHFASFAEDDNAGAKLWECNDGAFRISGGKRALKGISADDYARSLESDDHKDPPTTHVPVIDTQTESERERAPGMHYLSAVFKFLDGFFHNSAMCTAFCEESGADVLLDIALSSCNPYDLVSFPAFAKIAQVLKTMCDAKPHLVFPSLLRRTQHAVLLLKPLISAEGSQSSFQAFTDLSSSMPAGSVKVDGTTTVKALANAHILTHVLSRALSPGYTIRHGNHFNQLFSNLNFTDVYVGLIEDLGKLQANCTWEEIFITRGLSESLRTRSEPRHYSLRKLNSEGLVEPLVLEKMDEHSSSAGDDKATTTTSREYVLALKNLRTVRYLLEQVPKGIGSFFHSLGLAILPKRSEASVKQHAGFVAERLAKSVIWSLEFRRCPPSLDDEFTPRYAARILKMIGELFLRKSYSMESMGSDEALTLLLNKFYLEGGLFALNKYLERFVSMLPQEPDKNQQQRHDGDEVSHWVGQGVHSILAFYDQIVRSKCIIESAQSTAISVRDRTVPDFFMPRQFVVEIRDAVLPAINNIWNSPDLERLSHVNMKEVVDILRLILKGEGEEKEVVKRSEKAYRRGRTSPPIFRLKEGRDVAKLQEQGFDKNLSREALYRCNNHLNNAEQYCRLRQSYPETPKFPIPSDDQVTVDESDQGPLESSAETNNTAEEVNSVSMEDVNDGGNQNQSQAAPNPSAENDEMSSNDGNLGSLGALPENLQQEDLNAMISSSAVSAFFQSVKSGELKEPFVTIDDLDEKRASLRSNLIDRCLEVLSTHPTITFELADLIQAAVAKPSDGTDPRSDIAETLVTSLISLQGGESSKESGVKIHAYAHLVALILQDRDFFTSALEQLSGFFGNLVEWIELKPEQKVEDAPWIEMILLIIERALAEDEQPLEVKFVTPPSDDPLKSQPTITARELIVSSEMRIRLLDTLLNLMPKLSSNASLVLSVCRAMSVLTRKRELASRLSEKQNMGRLFLMVRQLSASVNEKIHGAIMLILRHMIEDDGIVRQIMRSEVRGWFESQRPPRQVEGIMYSKTLAHLVIRNPDIFVEVTKELTDVCRFDDARDGKEPRLYLTLKRDQSGAAARAAMTDDADASGASGEGGPTAKQNEGKIPVVETTDGVIQSLLRELSNYKDVEDKVMSAQPTANPDTKSANQLADSSGVDVEMSDATTTSISTTSEHKSVPNPSKQEESVIFIYRRFILQCLSELLVSYTRTKLEFINFSRKSESQPSTPSKPRAGTLNYLLNNLLPVGTLEHRDDEQHLKRASISGWAINVLVSLCTKTSERVSYDRYAPTPDALEGEPDLAFVRRFVLEHALRSFKEATSSTEPLGHRYSRLLALGDLFNRILTGKFDAHRATLGRNASHEQIARLMYEKNFVSTLTAAIAELDLNFPNAKRAVKYILAPLKQLTELGVAFSQRSDIFPNGPGTGADEDEISSATSLSEDDEDDREQTPDLFRGSSLGMFESSGATEDDSDDETDEDEDDEMYDDEYDEEEMEYEGEPLAEHGDVVSDEDDDMGPIEGLPGDVEMDVEMIMEGDDSEDDDEDDDDDNLDDDDDEDDQDDDGFGDHVEEITGDDENASLDDHDEEADWEDDDIHYDGHDRVIIEDGNSVHGEALEHIAHVMGADDPTDDLGQGGLLQMDLTNGDEEFFDDEMAPEDDEDDEDEDPDLDNDVVYEPELENDDDDEDDDDDEPAWRWDGRWDAPPPQVLFRGGHHHHNHPGHHAGSRGVNQMFGMGMMDIGGESFRAPGFRTHRPAPIARDEDGLNPLLQRDATHQRRDILDLPFGTTRRRALLPRPGENPFQELLNVVGPAAGDAGLINVNVDPTLPTLAGFPAMFLQGRHGPGHAVIDVEPGRLMRDPSWLNLGARLHDLRHGALMDEPSSGEFRPYLTPHRWQEEVRMLFPGKYQDQAAKIVRMLLRTLVPPALETKRLKDEADRKAAEEEQRKKAEQEKQEREAKEKEQQAAREREEQEARERAELEQNIPSVSGSNQGNVEMSEDNKATHTAAVADSEGQTAAEPGEAPRERITIALRGGRVVDITDLGIDPEYLEALPEDMREDVVMTQVHTQQAQMIRSGDQPTEISREFLSALPLEIQEELLRSEERERRHRQREDARRRTAQDGAGAPPPAEDVNGADFIAGLDPGLRQTVLMESDDSILAILPEELQAEARLLTGNRRIPNRDLGRVARSFEVEAARILNGQPMTGRAPGTTAHDPASRQRRPVAQMLDKSGVATLLRLMFVSLNHKVRSNLHSILSDVCKNTQNRAEVISILLSILQDGTADHNAVERSFAHLSLKAKQSSGPRTPQPLKRMVTGTPALTPSADLSPLNIVQQCLGTLNALSNDNPRVPSFFLSEHETTLNQKNKTPSKKGKVRENKASKFPLNALLTLLDRKLITENTAVMESLASLLSHVTHPLTILLRRAKEQPNKDAKPSVGASEDTSSAQDPATAPATTMPETSVGDATADSGTQAPEPTNAPESDAKKKRRDLQPPEVPEENIRLVVNILAARECPSKTFSDTLDIIKNLSAIPGAKEVFGRELIRQAQELADILVIDLNELAQQIHTASTDTSLQGIALANFSSAGSKQRKILRVLVALDHLFDPKRIPGSSNASSSSVTDEQKLKQDILASFYESPTFQSLWESLSKSLAAIRTRGNMVNVATILLPLIESLMVVCRNSAPRSSSPSGSHTRMDELFFNFTEEHRKILNELIRNNPKLMKGNLSVLANNSKVLEFDNKQNYFKSKLHDRRSESRISQPSLTLNVRRNDVFLDSFKGLYFKSGDEIKYGKLNIRFSNEEGVDAGGVSREWFTAMARQMFLADYALFNSVASDRTTFHPNPLSAINPEHLVFFKFVGRIIGKALYEGRHLDAHFSRAVYRRILGKSVSLKDMESLDLDYYKSLVWILENDITDVTFETFSYDMERFGVTETVDLIENGRNVPVTQENKQEYVRLVVEYRLIKSVEEQLDHLLEGFYEIVPAELIAIFNEQELELLISGLPNIDVDDWKNNTEYHNYQATSPQIQWFWRAVRSFDQEERAKLLQFVTGTSKVPLAGFKELEGMNGFARFNIHRDYSSKEKLPSSHTCFNQLDLPEYESYEHLRQQLYTAITTGSEYFGFA